MATKLKKKRASLKLDSDGQIKDEVEESKEEKPVPPSARQVVEVVEDGSVPEAIETIKRDAEEIEKAVEAIEDDLEREAVATASPEEIEEASEEKEEQPKEGVGSLFMNSDSAVPPEITVVGKRGGSLGVWVGAMLGVALAIGVSLILLVKGPQSIPGMGPKPTATPTVTVAPTPSPVSAIKRSDITVSVLNGGGVAGAGSKMKEILENKGYKVTNVGNASDYSYTETEVLVKDGKEAYAKLLVEDLASDYSVSSSSGTVEDNADYDAQVIVGSEE